MCPEVLSTATIHPWVTDREDFSTLTTSHQRRRSLPSRSILYCYFRLFLDTLPRERRGAVRRRARVFASRGACERPCLHTDDSAGNATEAAKVNRWWGGERSASVCLCDRCNTLYISSTSLTYGRRISVVSSSVTRSSVDFSRFWF